jgi:hypothetical protein
MSLGGLSIAAVAKAGLVVRSTDVDAQTLTMDLPSPGLARFLCETDPSFPGLGCAIRSASREDF